MNAKALFENKSLRCRVEIVHDNGKVETEDFYKVSDLVNFVNERGIDIPLSNCHAVDSLDEEKPKEK